MGVLSAHQSSLLLSDRVEDGVGGVKDVGQHGRQLCAGYTLVFVQVEHSEEKHAAVVEGAVQHDCKAAHKFLKADLPILDGKKITLY